MTKYASNNYFLFDKVMYLLIFIGIAFFITYRLADNISVLLVGTTIILLLLTFLIRVLTRLASVQFREDKLVINYLIVRKQEIVDYTDINELKHLFWYPVFSQNIIRYKDGQNLKVKKLKIRSVVPIDEFNGFITWLKNKNSNIHFSFTPSDSPAELAFKERYG